MISLRLIYGIPASSNEGSAIISDNRLTLAVPPGSSIFRIREDLVVSDFLCRIDCKSKLVQRTGNEYGLLVRASAVAYYRLVLICNGTLRLDRVSGNSRQILRPPFPVAMFQQVHPRKYAWAYGLSARICVSF